MTTNKEWNEYSPLTRLIKYDKFLCTGTRGQVPLEYDPTEDMKHTPGNADTIRKRRIREEQGRMEAKRIREEARAKGDARRKLAREQDLARKALVQDKKEEQRIKRELARNMTDAEKQECARLKEQRKQLLKEQRQVEREAKRAQLLVLRHKREQEEAIIRKRVQDEHRAKFASEPVPNGISTVFRTDQDMLDEQARWERQEEEKLTDLLLDELQDWDKEQLRELATGLSFIGSAQAIQAKRLIERLMRTRTLCLGPTAALFVDA